MGGTFDYSVLVVVRVEYAFRGWKHVGGDGYWCARCWVLRDRACCRLRMVVDRTLGPSFAGFVLVGVGTDRMLRTTQWTRAS